ncbi:cob(I)yrinic acid a,c-diamide adenosyltransferase [Neorhodopirellula pilleata]|uniref:Corrinoid adenosyltransferase n=1 Tax=Neorhodopirellula pilleata TaxID=2714738 RepID=A0A5C6AA88_9BACT|nr:cob(I)yrinic acid a,c-diamide adenosyltransferase [Neorhodopirellula pilleata]TWT96356.1 Cob(I)yrinic acid a,c-diamide adenosyltransferase [Neorhodopirellula pilleata]
MKIYTRTGDSGTTGLFGGPRVAKDDSRIEAYGTVDELNAVLGCVRAAIDDTKVDDTASDDNAGDGQMRNGEKGSLSDLDAKIVRIQHELFSIGAELASPHPDEFNLRVIGKPHIDRLEAWIDESEGRLPPLKQFILPGGSAVASYVHLARAVCRRAERRVITLADAVESETPISDGVIVYLNRLSDWLFVVSRDVNRLLGRPDQPWEKP